MKIIFAYFVISLNLVAFSQTLTQEEKQAIINNLDSTKYWVREKAILDVLQYKISEALPVLEQKIFTQEQDIAGHYLEGLFRFNSPLAIEYAHKFIDTVESLQGIPGLQPRSPDSFSIKILRYDAAMLLFSKEDYSRADIILSWIDYRKPKITSEMPRLLKQILNNLPQYEVTAKNELLHIANSSEAEEYSLNAVRYLGDYYGDSIIPELLNIYSNNTYDMTRLSVLSYLDRLDYPNYENFLKENFNSDTTIAGDIMERLLLKFPSPSNYNFIVSNIESALTSFDQRYYGSWLTESYEPFPPNSLNTLFEFLDYINTLCDTLYEYAWLGDLQFKDDLQATLQSAKSILQAGDSVACAVQVKTFQDLVDSVYKDSLNADPRFVTMEGWKFLYWNAQYILDRLPAIPIILPPDIEVINPAMSLVNPGAFTMEIKGSGFNSSAVVYFNGNARATTFVSDSVLNTQILSTDVSVAGNYPVWVSDNTLNSDTLIYKVVSTLPQSVRPVLECVTNNGDGTYTAFFGYMNENSVSVYIPVGSKNKFTPTPQDRGQTRVFKPGRQIKVYTVNFNGSNLVWTLNGRTSTASSNSEPCQ
ncbi:MAG: hypothetical protein HXY48_01960 [Ignavibacteriaceae bacterium]|nr:hypothetical protein [Ignavibacteriaceae bacterium]